MKWWKSLSAQRARLTIALPALLLLMVVVALVSLSVAGRAWFDFAVPGTDDLGADDDIGAWVSFNQATYHQGDLARYRIRLLWRDDVAAPDLESLATNASFYPFDHRGSIAMERRLSGGIREYVADHTLQPVNVNVPATYRLETVTVYYTSASDGHVEVQALRVNPPLVHLGEFYPHDVSAISLLPTKPRLDDARWLRGTLMAVVGAALFLIALLLVWQYGRRRPYAELSAIERVWRDFDHYRRNPADSRQHVVHCEHIFTQVLELRAGIGPTAFWTERATAPGDWHDVIVEARTRFGAAYRPAEPSAADTEKIEELIDGLLTPVVEKERLQREMRDSPVGRLRRQPLVLAAGVVLTVSALVALVLAAAPAAWVATDIKAYNAAVGLVQDDADPRAALEAFLELKETTEDLRVKAASYYNAGTLTVDPRLARLSRAQYDNFLRAIFVPDTTLDRLLHDMELDAEFELLTLLTELTRQYVQAEELLKAAVRTDPRDRNARRNLELLGKIRRAIGRSLAGMVRQGEQSSGAQQMLGQTVIDLELLMEAELPDDYARQDEGKDDRDYFIMERF